MLLFFFPLNLYFKTWGSVAEISFWERDRRTFAASYKNYNFMLSILSTVKENYEYFYFVYFKIVIFVCYFCVVKKVCFLIKTLNSEWKYFSYVYH